ncbi:MAG: LysE family transporter [Chloroflexota bacterium]
MDITFLLRGFLIGLSIAAPVGPIGVLCIRRTIAEGRAVGLASGLGAATADFIYGAIGGFGLTFISDILVGQQSWLRLIGGIFLCYLGVKTFLSKPAEQPAATKGSGLIGTYSSTFFLTLTNPTTILSFVVIFGALGIGTSGSNYGSALILVLGVFLGSATWWVLLTGGVGLIRARVTPTALGWINRVAGVIIVGFGAVALLSLLR